MRAPDFAADTLIVVGGLYGNRAALDAAEARVQHHIALRGIVETELAGDDDRAGCGCAYPDDVSDAAVARSNAILARLRRTAQSIPATRRHLGGLPMHRVAAVVDLRIDAVALRYDQEAWQSQFQRDWPWGLRRTCFVLETHRDRPGLRSGQRGWRTFIAIG
ncbi:MAG: hypothetical protein HZC23_08470 [Rhodocyclales bacterium]|nr:hypothetical protein [Rhodocyclales bacterium]